MPVTRPLLERFIEKVSPEPFSGCWLWMAKISENGYGYIAKGLGFGNKMIEAHRASHELFKGPIPEGYEVDHLCRNTVCCAPNHLEAVTPEENMRRAGAAVTHCPRGHELTIPNTYFDKTTGRSSCLLCRRTAKTGKYMRGPRKSSIEKDPNLAMHSPTHCPRGHAWDEKNSYIPPDGRKRCRECMNASNKRSKLRRALSAQNTNSEAIATISKGQLPPLWPAL